MSLHKLIALGHACINALHTCRKICNDFFIPIVFNFVFGCKVVIDFLIIVHSCLELSILFIPLHQYVPVYDGYVFIRLDGFT